MFHLPALLLALLYLFAAPASAAGSSKAHSLPKRTIETLRVQGRSQPPSVTEGGDNSPQVDARPRIRIGVGTYQQSPNYSGTSAGPPLLVTQGTIADPAATSTASGVFQITTTEHSAQALAAMGWKTNRNTNARLSAIFGEAVDIIGGESSFVEGGRFQGTLVDSSANGSAYGTICAAGAQKGAATPRYLIGCEANTVNQRGPDAPTFTRFNKGSYTAGFVATNGCHGCNAFVADAAFVTNPYGERPFQTGFLIGEGSVTDTGIAFRPGASMATGIDMGRATLSSAALIIPNNAQIMSRNGQNNANLAILAVDRSNNLEIGAGISGQAIFSERVRFANEITLARMKVASLPNCGTAQEGTLEAVTDALNATFNSPLRGGGGNHVMAYCNGSQWTVH